MGFQLVWVTSIFQPQSLMVYMRAKPCVNDTCEWNRDRSSPMYLEEWQNQLLLFIYIHVYNAFDG